MRKPFGPLNWILIASALAIPASGLAQIVENQDGKAGTPVTVQASAQEKAPANIQVGFAVITPATAGSLVVFETFGMKSGLDTWQAGVLPPDLTTNAMLFVDSSRRLSKNIGVSIVNPGAVAANVTIALNNADGSLFGTTTIAVPSHQQTSKFVTELFAANAAVPNEVVGTLIIHSSSPVSVVGLRFRGLNFSTIPVTNLSVSGTLPVLAAGVGGAGAILLPQFVAGGGWGTQLVIANPGSTSLTVRLDLFGQDGMALSTTLNGQTGSSFLNLVIPAGGVLTIAPKDWDNDGDQF